MAHEITDELIDRLHEYSDTARTVARNAVAHAGVEPVAFDRAKVVATPTVVSHKIDDWKVTSQKKSGRCWLFSSLNLLRSTARTHLGLKDFEFSQNYVLFWDKFERCNYFLESILETAALPTGDRTVMHILSTGVHDGGQWDMFANIVRKYGVVPKDVYDETYQSSNTRQMNAVLNRALKAAAQKLRDMVVSDADDGAIQAEKNKVLDSIYGFLCSCYGEPPKAFSFEYVDKDKVYHIEENLTPLTFAERYVGDLLEQIVSIINAPTADKPYHKTYTVRLLGNVAEGRPVVHLNLTMDEFKSAIIAQLKAGKVVWFGSDVGHFGERTAGIWDDGSFNFPLLTGMDLAMDKANALDYGLAAMNHAMVLTGVNLDASGKPTRWKIENSWGDKSGDKGYYVCSDSWFDQYVFQAAVEKEYLGGLAALASQEPIVLEPWDPMGTLAD